MSSLENQWQKIGPSQRYRCTASPACASLGSSLNRESQPRGFPENHSRGFPVLRRTECLADHRAGPTSFSSVDRRHWSCLCCRSYLQELLQSQTAAVGDTAALL